jgi:aspartyl-tRNA(Asn)/glutamyl-tRNA(Gln) amidotransferase subunit B
VTDLGLPEYDAGVLVADKEVADYFETVLQHADGDAKAASNWVMTEVMRVLSESGDTPQALLVTPEALGSLIGLVARKVVNHSKAKEVFALLVAEGGDPAAIVEEKGWGQVSDSGAIDQFVQQAIDANPSVVEDYRSGKDAALQFLVGQVMRFSKGKANPQMASERLKEMLA